MLLVPGSFASPIPLGGAPSWVKYTKTFSDFSLGALTNTITLFTLPAGGIIHFNKIKHSVAFSGGSITSYVISMGIAGSETKYAGPFDVFQVVGNTTFQVAEGIGSESHSAGIAITVTATASHNLDTAAAGSCDFWVYTSVAT
jgi:hypothetical protein